MADPITIALIVGGGLQILSTIQEGQAAQAEGETQAAIAERNALLAERQAESQRQAAAAEALKQERKGKALKARQRALFAKSGVELRGSPLSVLVETAENLEADRLNILKEGRIAAGTSLQQAGIIRAQGASAKARGRATKRASILSAVGQGLTTVGTVGQRRSLLAKQPKAPKLKGGDFLTG